VKVTSPDRASPAGGSPKTTAAAVGRVGLGLGAAILATARVGEGVKVGEEVGVGVASGVGVGVGRRVLVAVRVGLGVRVGSCFSVVPRCPSMVGVGVTSRVPAGDSPVTVAPFPAV